MLKICYLLFYFIYKSKNNFVKCHRRFYNIIIVLYIISNQLKNCMLYTGFNIVYLNNCGISKKKYMYNYFNFKEN